MSSILLKAKVDENRCLGCGKCVNVCPLGAVRLVSQGVEDKPESIYEQKLRSIKEQTSIVKQEIDVLTLDLRLMRRN